MRAQGKRTLYEEEEESAFVSMTDMTVGFLFIMMILLAFFVSQIRDSEAVSRTEYDTVVAERDTALELIESVKLALKIVEKQAETILILLELVGTMAERVAFLEAELDKLQADYDEVVIERDDALELVETQRHKIVLLEDKLAKLKAEYDAVVIERDDALELVETQRHRIVLLEDKLAKLKAEYDAVVIERDDALELVETQRHKIVLLEDKLAKLKAEYDAVVIERDDALELVETQRHRIALLEAELDKLQADLTGLKQIDPLEAYLARVAKVRRDVLLRLRDSILLDFPELKMELSEESDALRFQGEGMFDHDKTDLLTQKVAIVARLSQRLDEVLPCFTIGPASDFSEDCNPGFVMIEAVQIEGHTDAEGSDERNRYLSVTRANNTYFAMTRAAPRIIKHQNLKEQPVLSVAAYGPDRPVTTNKTSEGKATNRRIDLRFIMVTPQDTDGIATIRQALNTISEKRQ